VASWQRRLLGFGLPCLYAFLLDAGLTLHGQPEKYWAGDYTWTTEGAPFWRLLYTWHPVAAVCGYVLWTGLLGGLLILLPEVLAVVLAITIAFGHTAGAYTWVQSMLLQAHGIEAKGWYQVANGMFLLSALAVGIGVRWVVRSAALHSESGPEPHMRGWVRGVLVAILLGSAAAIVFAPW
jgi:hypothetical protein